MNHNLMNNTLTRSINRHSHQWWFSWSRNSQIIILSVSLVVSLAILWLSLWAIIGSSADSPAVCSVPEQKPVLPPAVRSWSRQTGPVLTQMGESSRTVARLMDTPRIGDPRWESAFAQERDRHWQLHTEMKNIVAPQEVAGIHATYVSASYQFCTALDLMVEANEQLDISKAELGLSYLDSAEWEIERAADALAYYYERHQ